MPIRFTGQHFTIDRALIEDSIKFANLQPSDIVLDIGAGKGFLTVHLLKHSQNIIAIEKDSGLVLFLKQKFRHCSGLTILNCDFLKFRVPDRSFKVVSNIPYSITSKLLRILMFDNLERFKGGTLVTQLAPAKKIVSDTIFNPYIAFYRTFYSLKLEYEISPSSFMPPPTVQSALVSIKLNPFYSNQLGKAKYLRFIQVLIKSPKIKLQTALKSVFRKSQIRSLCLKHSIYPEVPVDKVNPSIWKICYDEMLIMVPERFHP